MTQSNSPSDSFIARRDDEMAAFDRLPEPLRQALRETRVQWSALSIERFMITKKISAEEILRRLLSADAQL
jgi:Family of unknown function (DUF6525)